MILTKPTPWGEIRGKLSLTPEQAKRMFGFNMSPYAKGVVLQKRRGKLMIMNLCRYTHTGTKEIKKRQRVFGIIIKIAAKHMEDLIYPIWEKETRRKNWSPRDLFMSINLKKICECKKNGRKKWRNMVIAQGTIEPPKRIYTRFYKKSKEIMIAVKNIHSYQIGIAVLEMTTFNLYHWKVEAEQKQKENMPIVKRIDEWNHIYLHIPEIKSPVVFTYFKNGEKCSNSRGTIPVCINA